MPDLFDGEAPDAAGIDALYTHLDALWSLVRADMVEMDDYHDGKFAVWKDAADTRTPIHPPTARYLIDNAVDTQMSADPTVKKFPAGEGEEHKDRADAVEPALTAVMLDASMKEPMIPWRQAYLHLIKYGYTVIGVEWEEEGGPEEPKREKGERAGAWKARGDAYEIKRRGWNPIRIKAPRPSRVLMDPLDMQPSVAVIVGQRFSQTLYDITRHKAQYGDSKEVTSYTVDANPYRLQKTLEVWTSNWHCLKLLGGAMLFVERNPFGVQTYAHGFAGWGSEGSEEEEDGGSIARHLAVGLLAGKLEYLKMQAQEESAKHNAVMEHGFARLGTSRPAEEAAQQMEKGPNAVLAGEKDDWWFLKSPDFSQHVWTHGEVIDRELERATYSRVQAGERQAGVTTVGQQQILKQASDRKFYVPTKQIERLATITARNILQMVDIRGEVVTVGGKALRPKDIEGSYDVMVEFKQVDPLIQMDMDRLNLEKFRLGIISAETVREAAGMENEAEERKRLIRQEVDRLPEVHAEMLANAVQEAGFIAVAERMREAVKAAKEAGVGLPGQPPVPSEPEPVPASAAPLPC
mgnify:CR=1 FL=1